MNKIWRSALVALVTFAMLFSFTACSEETMTLTDALTSDEVIQQLADALAEAESGEMTDPEIVTIVAAGLADALTSTDDYDDLMNEFYAIGSEVCEIDWQVECNTLYISDSYAEGSYLLKSVYYDADGNLSKEVYYYDDDYEVILTANFNTDGTLSSLVIGDGDDAVNISYDLTSLTSSSEIDSEYGSTGLVYTGSNENTVKEVWYYSGTTDTYVEKYYDKDGDEIRFAEYDSAGNLVSEVYYLDEGDVSAEYESDGTMYYAYADYYDWDELLKVAYYDSESTLTKAGYYYDSYLVFEDTYDSTGTVTSTEYYEDSDVYIATASYADSNSSATMTVKYKDSVVYEATVAITSTSSTETEETEDDEDESSVVYVSKKYYSDDSLILENSYDSDGKLASETYYSDGSKIAYFTYAYDKDDDYNYLTYAAYYDGDVQIRETTYDEYHMSATRTLVYDYAKYVYDYQNDGVSIEMLNDYKGTVNVRYSDSTSGYVYNDEWGSNFYNYVQYDVVIASGSTITLTADEEDDGPSKVIATVNATIDDVAETLYLEAYWHSSCYVYTADNYPLVLTVNGEDADLTEDQIVSIVEDLYWSVIYN